MKRKWSGEGKTVWAEVGEMDRELSTEGLINHTRDVGLF